MYVSAINTFSNSFKRLLTSILELSGMLLYLKTYFEFIDLSVTADRKGTKDIEIINEIELKDIWFKYPSSEEYILKGVNLKLNKHESLAIVGDNGAGKTTLIKLLCGLYKPTKGEILINQVPLEDINYNKYINKLGAVFQDFKLFSFNIRENITLSDKLTYNKKFMEEALKNANLKNVINKLPKGLDTRLYKIFDEEAIELSGGQNQKVAIARADYKNSTIVIMDEPTASLDPIAENEIYHNFQKLAKNKITVYISHRMSSCLYCDKIILLENGEVKEEGTHQSLIDLEGTYYDMFNMQAKYYSCTLSRKSTNEQL